MTQANSKRPPHLLAAIMISMVGLLAQAADPGLDSQVASRIHEFNQMEIKMGEIAKKKGTTLDVRRFGDQIVRDHTAADKELTSVASEMGLKLSDPVARTALERKQESDMMELLRKLRRSRGPNFDFAFLGGMKEGHQQVLELMKSDLSVLEPSELKTYISSKFLASLQHHYEIAMNLESKAMAEAEKNPPAG